MKELEGAPGAPGAKPMGVELGKIVVTPETGKGPAAPQPAQPATKGNNFAAVPALTGKIIVVNKDYNFVVINLGASDGVSVGEVFSVSRKDKYIGDIKVEKVHDTMSAAGFVSADLKNKFSEGDRVVLKTK
ncbi:MAG: hypothetical protein PHF11_04340 [Candidatus Omnitrophica bacterium]|nr:hypothetical protein [Candidatus Omnitrophota bacterium]